MMQMSGAGAQLDDGRRPSRLPLRSAREGRRPSRLGARHGLARPGRGPADDGFGPLLRRGRLGGQLARPVVVSARIGAQGACGLASIGALAGVLDGRPQRDDPAPHGRQSFRRVGGNGVHAHLVTLTLEAEAPLGEALNAGELHLSLRYRIFREVGLCGTQRWQLFLRLLELCFRAANLALGAAAEP